MLAQNFGITVFVRKDLIGHNWFTPKLTWLWHLPLSFMNLFLTSNPFLLKFVVQPKYGLGDTLWYSWIGEGVRRLSKVVKGFHAQFPSKGSADTGQMMNDDDNLVTVRVVFAQRIQLVMLISIE